MREEDNEEEATAGLATGARGAIGGRATGAATACETTVELLETGMEDDRLGIGAALVWAGADVLSTALRTAGDAIGVSTSKLLLESTLITLAGAAGGDGAGLATASGDGAGSDFAFFTGVPAEDPNHFRKSMLYRGHAARAMGGGPLPYLCCWCKPASTAGYPHSKQQHKRTGANNGERAPQAHDCTRGQPDTPCRPGPTTYAGT